MDPPADPNPNSPFVSSEMNFGFPPIDDSDSTALFDWGDFLDFDVNDNNHNHFVIPSPSPFDLDGVVAESPPAATVDDGGVSGGDRVRKRDPKLTCENFLAGRVPCACPEMDALLAEEEELRGTGKKRARTVKAGGGAAGTGIGVVLRCQVVGCEVDISELKGYHKRHRVCLKCANASEILIDGETKRYCQQCGKFHVLSDFDEGKRSCRRKLEIHNNRRRRKHTNLKGSSMEETQEVPLIKEIGSTIEDGKGLNTVNFIKELAVPVYCFIHATVGEMLKTKVASHVDILASEDLHVANLCSTLGSQDTRSDSPESYETNMDGAKYSSKNGPCSSNGDTKSAFSSICPTGRISFKLYDWNPAEFPRRLRHQIFQWLASMPVELEGYIRPGCTILTIFFSMPKFMWVELFKDPTSQLEDFVSAPGRLLCGKGSIHVYLNNLRLVIARDGTFVKKVMTDVKAPRLHYVHPTFFEAGKPMEFVVCGSNLLQPRFKFLVSFQEKYIASDCCLSFSLDQPEKKSCSFEHQKYKINAPLSNSNVFGPAFIEVENEFGLSNYIPVLVADKDVCAEMEVIQQKCVQTFHSKSSACEADKCDIYMQRHATLSEFVLDIAWLLKKPTSESFQDNLTSSQIATYVSVLNYLKQNDSYALLDRVLKSLSIRISSAEKSNPGYTTCEDGIRLLHKKMDQARNILRQKQSDITSTRQVFPSEMSKCSVQQENTSIVPTEDTESTTAEHKCISLEDSTSTHSCETVPFLCMDDVVSVKHTEKWPRQSCGAIISRTRITPPTRATVSIAVIAIVCFGVCAVILHPHKVGQFAVTVRRCLFDGS